MATIIPFTNDDSPDELAADDRPNRELRTGALIAGLFFIGFLGCAAVAPLDAAAIASGQLVVSGHRQTIQHAAGGRVTRVRVTEGQRVTQGEILIELAGVELRAEQRAAAALYVGLLAQQARLTAELTGTSAILWPAELDPNRLPIELITRAKLVQHQQFAARRALLTSQQQLLSRQSLQARQSGAGYASQVHSSVEQERLLDQELAGLEQVAAKGFVSANHVRAMKRERAEMRGRAGMYASDAARAQVEGQASELKRVESQKSYRERAADELRQVEFALADAAPKFAATSEQVEQLNIRAPIAGTIVGLAVFAGDTVIASGQPLMDLVPTQPRLVIDARFPLENADELTIGQKADLKFPSLHNRNLPIIHGKVTRISADSLIDSKSGAHFYAVEVRVGKAEFERLTHARGRQVAIRPGTPAEVVVRLRRRTALEYLLEPLSKSIWNATPG